MKLNKRVWIILFIVFIVLLIINYNVNTMKVVEGSDVPIFELKNQYGELFSIDSVIGKKNLVIFFYPKDDSPGCTKQACSFRDQFEVFKNEDAIIIGINNQSIESHLAFSKKYRLNYLLLSDTDNKVKKMFGVPNNLFGLIPGRVTYVVNKKGKVVYVFNSQMNVEKHVDEALRILKEMK